MSLLSIDHLSVEMHTRRGRIRPVDGISFQVKAGEALGIVGESGSGKSVTSLAIMGLLTEAAKREAKQLEFLDQNLLTLSEKRLQRLRGAEIAMIFQDPMTSLNPSYTVEFQLIETLKLHRGGNRAELRAQAEELLKQVGIPDPSSRLKAYPHQLSGGMAQRVMIAIAIACNPKLLIADEPTTALDVTIQAQILELLKTLQRERGMALILVSHNLGVVAQNTDRLVVMYAGQIVEQGPTREVLQKPLHPYTQALLKCLPHKSDSFRSRLQALPGRVPDLTARPLGCQLAPRCPYKEARCQEGPIADMWRGARMTKCWKDLYKGEL